jgi:dihydrolipoamide dehydrogenase
MAAYYNYDLIVIGGGPAGYAAAIRAGQLKKRVLCVEKEALGGTCLNWGCIPTKALLDNANLVRTLKHNPQQWGISFDNLKVDFTAVVKRSRDIAGKLSKGIAFLFSKYQVKHEQGVAQVTAKNKVNIKKPDGKTLDVTGEHILVCTGARARSLPGIEFDGKQIISSREAMVLESVPKKLVIIGAGAIGCEFADVYNAMGSEITIVEYLDHLLPIEDEDCSILLERVFKKRGINVLTKHKADKVEKTKDGLKVTITTSDGKDPQVLECDKLLMAVGVTGNVENVFAKDVGVTIEKGHIKTTDYKTNVEGIWAAGDVIGPPWLAHVAHHEAVYAVERIFKWGHPHTIDYKRIPGCTYTHPQVASIGVTEKKAREQGLNIKIGKFPFAASGRAMAAGETDGFVKLIFDAKYGELLGAHLIGEHVTEMLAELGLAQKLEATEEEILQLMHPHPTLSEAIMEAAGVADGRAIHI